MSSIMVHVHHLVLLYMHCLHGVMQLGPVYMHVYALMIVPSAPMATHFPLHVDIND